MSRSRIDIDQTLSALTLAEKAALVSGADFWHTVAIERLGVPAIMCADGPHGLRAQIEDADHMGLSGSVPATCYPTASAVASSWDPDLLAEIGGALAREASQIGVSVVLGPGVNIKRSPLCGRNFEYLSEDPFLAGELGAAIVDGLQSGGVGASVKHYAANNQEHDRLRVSAEVDERTLREIYLPAFERVVTGAQPWTVMCAYNRVNGTHASQHHWLLTEVLRDEWGFDGVVVSDWGAVHDRVAALRAGLDWEMPPDLPDSPDAVVDAVTRGDLDEAVLNRSVTRMLRMVDRATSNGSPDPEPFDVDAHHDLARRAAAAAMVLLKNDRGLLPLETGSVALIGEFARTPRFQGAGSSQVSPTRVSTLLEELVGQLGAERVTFEPGFTVDGDGDATADAALRERAVAAARQADVVVCVLGLPGSYESEGFDRTHMDLPGAQLQVLTEVLEANGDVVVVLVNGATVEVASWADDVPALLEAWLGGQAAGAAIADVLTGTAEPSGRLAETMPVRLEDNSSYLNFPGDPGVVRYGEGVFVGYRAYDAQDLAVSYPFGFGLGYTTFELSDLDLAMSGRAETGDLAAVVTVTVTNTGPRPGSETVQVYVADAEAAVARPPRELKGFAKVHLDAGRSVTVEIPLDQRAFSYWSARHDRWVVEAGTFTIAVGHNSRNLPLQQIIEVAAPPLTEALTAWSTLQEWVNDPIGQELLTSGAGESSPLADEELVRVIGSMPLGTLAGFPAVPLSHADVDALTTAWTERAHGTEPTERTDEGDATDPT